jgi:acyl carrier protein
VEPTPDIVQQSVYRAIDDFNLSENATIPHAPDTVLLGQGGAVDSLGLVRLILTVERQIESDFDRAVSLTDDKAMSQRNSPFRTVGTLTEYIAACLAEGA